MASSILNALEKYKVILKYFCVSVIVTVFDIVIVWVLRNGFNTGIVFANTVGVVCGSVLQYFLVSKHVFYVAYGIRGILVFFGTFLFGLLLADWIIWVSSRLLEGSLGANLNLLVSKGFSIVIPFFVLYGIRKVLFDALGKRKAHAGKAGS